MMEWTPTETSEAASRIATLEGLHRELEGVLGDDWARDNVWRQIEVEFAELTNLMTEV